MHAMTPQQKADDLKQALREEFRLTSEELSGLLQTLTAAAPYVCHRCGQHGVHQQDNCKTSWDRT